MKKISFLFMTLLSIALILVVSGCGSEKTTVDPDAKTGLKATEINNEAFKELFPLQYDSYMKSSDDSKDTKYAGSQARSKFSDDKEPLLPILFNGFGFATDYNEDRGHVYAVEDIERSLRINDKSPGACMTCKSSAVPQLVEEMGDAYWSGNFQSEIVPAAEAKGHSSIGCSDCHDPETMNLRITRTPLIKALEARGVDLAKATRNEMRSYVCAQCHVEYYFAPSNKEVVLPWTNGFQAEEMEKYYNTVAAEAGFKSDFIQNVSGTPILKAQHPDYETYMEGPHGKAGVSCADCHMQYERNGETKKKYSNHNWGSPLNTMETSCGNCHGDKDMKELKAQVEETQTTYKEALDKAEEVSVYAHYYVNKMVTSGAPAEKIAEAKAKVRTGQWLWDFCAAENSTGSHNPQGSMEDLMKSSVASNEAKAIAIEELTKLGVNMDEIDAQIQLCVDAVKAEKGTAAKKGFAVNAYFPGQQPK